MDFQAYLSRKYQGHESFLENVIFPIFGEENYVTAWDVELLDSEELRSQANRTGIRSIIRCGTIDVDLIPIEVFDITVSDRIVMDKNRVGVQALIRRVMDTYSGAFMIIHYDNDLKWDWRFTFCQLKEKNEYTDSKRFTFLLGPNQSCRTAAENFKKLAELNQNISIKDIQAAFDVEALSKEFFKKYKWHYERFVEYITGKSFVKEAGKFVEKKTSEPHPEYYAAFNYDDKYVRDYVKLTLGRIILCHFLQKKGWLGVLLENAWGSGDEQFMRNLYLNASEDQKADFLEQVLEPFFFGGLNTDRRDNDDLFICPVNGKIRVPYLNGGLFEQNRADNVKVRFPKEYFDDLLKFFSEYNFTIDENDPNEAQVGIDPEMLSQIFENLLEDNKDKGAFYTPKEIVQYMCQESLIAYLGEKTQIEDERIRSFILKPYETVTQFTRQEQETILLYLRDVKICDPAIGSGAFPMGMLNEIVKCEETLVEELGEEELNRAELKKHIIQNNIYGVDIEKGAVDIARLRFWLSIVVDEETPSPLPNLDFKIMQGNSLLESYNGIDLSHLMEDEVNVDGTRQLSIYEDAIQDAREELTVFLKDYFNCSDHEEKNRIKADIKIAIETQLSGQNIDIDLSNIDISGNDKFFLWHTWFADVFNRPSDCDNRISGFDIVIGNPPYIKEYTNRSAFDGFRETSPYYIGKMDLWYGFACHGIDLLCNSGSLCFIAQNNWTTSSGAKKLRYKITKDAQIRQILDFNTYMVFDDADIQTMIMLFSKNNISDTYIADVRKLTSGAQKIDMLALLNKQQTSYTAYISPLINSREVSSNTITFVKNTNLIDQISGQSEHLSSSEVAQGIVFPQDFLDKKGQTLLGPDFRVGEGVFGLSTEEYQALKLNDTEKSLIKPYFTSAEIQRYYTSPNNKLWLIYTGSAYNQADSMDDCPTIKSHLDRYQAIITSSNKPYGLHRARCESFFKGEKIISQRKCVGRPCFSYCCFDSYITQTYFVIKTERWDMRFLTGVLNSKLVGYWLKTKGKMQGNNYQVDKEPLLSIPLPHPSVRQDIIANLVGLIIAAIQKGATEEITKIEGRINEEVYALYGIKSDDIAIIDEVF